MTNVEQDELVQSYLARLRAAASALPAERRGELVAEIQSHIADGLAENGGDPAALRTLLDRLGAPEDIVAAEAGGFAAAPGSAAGPGGPPGYQPGYPPGFGGPAAASSPWGLVEIFAVLLLTVGAYVLPGVGPLVGLVLAMISAVWTVRDKLLVVLLALGLPLLGLLGMLFAFVFPVYLGLAAAFGVIALGAFVTPVLAGVYLLVVTGRRAVPAGSPAPRSRGPLIAGVVGLGLLGLITIPLLLLAIFGISSGGTSGATPAPVVVSVQGPVPSP